MRRPTEADHAGIVKILDHWFGGRRVSPLAARAWFRHFAKSSWLAEDENGSARGILLGYRSPGQREVAVIQLLAVDPARRRRGIARALLDAFLIDSAGAGAVLVEIVVPPDEHGAIAALTALGFHADDGPGTQRLYGVPATPDYEGDGEDRALFVRRI